MYVVICRGFKKKERFCRRYMYAISGEGRNFDFWMSLLILVKVKIINLFAFVLPYPVHEEDNYYTTSALQ